MGGGKLQPVMIVAGERRPRPSRLFTSDHRSRGGILPTAQELRQCIGNEGETKGARLKIGYGNGTLLFAAHEADPKNIYGFEYSETTISLIMSTDPASTRETEVSVRPSCPEGRVLP